jgi:pyrimidine operon attenuation protein / uracil phosphoribosyltransferase
MEGKNILKTKKIKQITERIAYQIYENFLHEDEVVVLGVKENGYLFAEVIVEEMNKLKKSTSKISLCSVSINKQEPLKGEISFCMEGSNFTSKPIILVDDVLNSGKTMMHVLAKLSSFNCKLIRTVVLVDRLHRDYPVRADFVGLTLSTTIEEHIEVEFSKGEINAYLK